VYAAVVVVVVAEAAERTFLPPPANNLNHCAGKRPRPHCLVLCKCVKMMHEDTH
jgi:hypothetical protein